MKKDVKALLMFAAIGLLCASCDNCKPSIGYVNMNRDIVKDVCVNSVGQPVVVCDSILDGNTLEYRVDSIPVEYTTAQVLKMKMHTDRQGTNYQMKYCERHGEWFLVGYKEE